MAFTVVSEKSYEHGTVIKVVGVGGAGGNAVNRMIEQSIRGVDYIACNTDRQVLNLNKAETKIVLGNTVTRGLGAGGNPEVGAAAAEEEKETIRQHLSGADLVFIAAGMGGGTGTGAAPIIAKIAKECGALTVGVVSKPFSHEGKKKMEIALAGIEKLKKNVDTLITIPNDKVIEVLNPKATLIEAFYKADEVLKNSVRSITEIITVPGIINIDFADVRAAMEGKGDALIGTGHGSGENKVAEAVEQVFKNPFLDGMSLDGATRILINIVASSDVNMDDYQEINSLITSKASPVVHATSGLVIKEDLNDEIYLTVIATGFERPAELDFGSKKDKEVAPMQRSLSRESRPSPQSSVTTPKKPSIAEVYGIQGILRNGSDHVWGLSGLDPIQLSIPSVLRNQVKISGDP